MQGGRQQEGEETNAREAESDAGREGVGEVEKLKEADSERWTSEAEGRNFVIL